MAEVLVGHHMTPVADSKQVWTLDAIAAYIAPLLYAYFQISFCLFYPNFVGTIKNHIFAAKLTNFAVKTLLEIRIFIS